MRSRGAIITLAYPDIFVRATEGRYNWLLSKVGIVNSGYVRAGHAAVLFVFADGSIEYADFGRYITPQYKGRCRTKLTDPDVLLDMKAEFTDEGQISNLEEILLFIRSRPDITHGQGEMCAGVHYFDDISNPYTNTRILSLKGSVDYGPWTMQGTNCSRFVWSRLWEATFSLKFKLRLLVRFFPSPMPNDLVMLARPEDRFVVKSSKLLPFSIGKWPMWMRLFEKPSSEHFLYVAHGSLHEGKGTLLKSFGAAAWFSIDRVSEDGLYISRRDERGNHVFSHWYQRPINFDPTLPYRFVFDCNAHVCHVLQEGKRLRLERHYQKPSERKQVGDITI